MKSVFQNLTLFTLILTPQIYPQSWWQQHGQNIINCGFVLHVAGSAITIAILLKKITALEKTQKQQATPENLVTKNELETNYVKKTDLNTRLNNCLSKDEAADMFVKKADTNQQDARAVLNVTEEVKKNNQSSKTRKSLSKNDSNILVQVKQIVSQAESTVASANNLLIKIPNLESRVATLELQSKQIQATSAKHHALHFLTGQIILGQNKYPAFPNHHAMYLANKCNYAPKLKDAKEQELFKNYCNFLNILSTQVPEKLAESLD